MTKLIYVAATLMLTWGVGSYVEVVGNNLDENYVYSNVNAFKIMEDAYYEETTSEPTTAEITMQVSEPTKECLGCFEISAYCPCQLCSEGYGRQTSTGATATAGRTIAVDPNVIPYGTHVFINGNEYVAEDCGGDIKGNRIDMFFDTHAETLEWGRRSVNVYR